MLPKYNKYNEFESINEGNLYKKNFGVIGPLKDGTYKVRGVNHRDEFDRKPGSLFIMNLNEESPNVSLGYLYKSKEGELETESIEVPRNVFDVSGQDKYPILTSNPRCKWMEDNSDKFEDFLDGYIQSQPNDDDHDSVRGDVEFILDLLGIDTPIEKVEPRKDGLWTIYLSGGPEMDITKKGNDNFLNSLKFYLTKNDSNPCMDIYKQKGKTNVQYKTPKGVFTRPLEKMSDLKKSPLHQYLSKTSMGKPTTDVEGHVLNQWTDLLKGHDWGHKTSRDDDYNSGMAKEINGLKKILSNSISDENLDKIYNQTRIKSGK